MGWLGWAGLGLGWGGLGWAGLGSVALGWAKVGRAGLGWAGLGWAQLGSAGLGWAGLGWAGLGWAGLGWAVLGWSQKTRPRGLPSKTAKRSGTAAPNEPKTDQNRCRLGAENATSESSKQKQAMNLNRTKRLNLIRKSCWQSFGKAHAKAGAARLRWVWAGLGWAGGWVELGLGRAVAWAGLSQGGLGSVELKWAGVS